jgi:signal transduction histidine kinase
MQAMVPTGTRFGSRDERVTPQMPPTRRDALEKAGGALEGSGSGLHAGSNPCVGGDRIGSGAGPPWLAPVIRFPWWASLAGFLAGLAVLLPFHGGWGMGGSVVAGVFSLGAAALAFRQLQDQEEQKGVHWAGQLGRLVQCLGKSDDGVVVTDRGLRVQWAGPGYCRTSGKVPGEVLGRPIQLLEGAGTDDEQRARLQAVIETGGSWRGEWVNRVGEGELRKMEQWVLGVRGTKGGVVHLLAVRREVPAEGHRLEEMVRANETMGTRLLQVTSEFSQFKRELEMLSFAVGHQLRSAQIGLTEVKVVLGMEPLEAIPAHVRREVEWMMRSGARMLRLIECFGWLHDLKERPLELDRVDLSALAVEILDGFTEVEPLRSIRLSVEPRMSAVGDARLLRVMFANLLGNAWRFSRTTTAARIEVGTVAEPGPAGKRTFFIRDNGVGLDRSWVGRVLSGRDLSGYLESASGTRLGLVVVERIVERHRGQIWAEAPLAGGVEFRFTLG